VRLWRAYCAAELLAGKISYPVRGYTGYGDGIGKDLRACIDDIMRADCVIHREVLLEFWIRARHAAVGVVDARGPSADR